MHEHTAHQKVAMLTGANKGIGSATAEQLAELGMTILIGARNPRRGEQAAEAVRAAGGDAHPVTLDVTDPASAAYSPSKTVLNALTVQYANELRKAGILVNRRRPGYVDTDSNNHTGFLTTAQGAAVVGRLATLGADGPTGGFFGEGGPVPW
ncbi:SDR family NAD(P)-dependent oxidoreductase [Nonomuraea sp. NPDC050643]|uniref:SDR family NAD(P)-dependent oxidoreductase n=1 Tax=Nonomuraea sp. NPDC050643 TaxID=3155660 RepID=UPI0033CC9270